MARSRTSRPAPPGGSPAVQHDADGDGPAGGGSPSHGGFGSSPTAPSTPGGGAYGGSPPSTPGGGSPSPAHGGGTYGGSSTPTSSGIRTSSPTPFVAMDPHSFGSLPASCDYWRSHLLEIWWAIGGRSFPSTSSSSPSMGMTGNLFGSAAAGRVGGADVSIQDALSNTRADGAGALQCEGAAAQLNSMTHASFPYTTAQVNDAFAAAAAGGSDAAAAAQAASFRKANEGKA